MLECLQHLRFRPWLSLDRYSYGFSIFHNLRISESIVVSEQYTTQFHSTSRTFSVPLSVPHPLSGGPDSSIPNVCLLSISFFTHTRAHTHAHFSIQNKGPSQV